MTVFLASFAPSDVRDPFEDLWVWLGWIGSIALLAVAVRFVLHKVRASQSADWPIIEGTIFSADIQESDLEGGFLYAAEFVYSYSANGEYFSSKATIPVSHLKKEAQALIDRFPSGTKVMIRYQPDNPSRSFFRVEDQPIAAPTST